MQFYDLTTVTAPTDRERAAIDAISAGIAALILTDERDVRSSVEFRVAASAANDTRHLIADVVLDDLRLPIDFRAWAFVPNNYDKAVKSGVARVREIHVRGERIRDHLRRTRALVDGVVSRADDAMAFVDLHFWPIDASFRLRLRDLQLELRVDMFGSDLARRREAFHGYGVRDLTSVIRRSRSLQRRIVELRSRLQAAGVPLSLDQRSQLQLVEGKVTAARLAKRIVDDATSGTDASGRVPALAKQIE